MVFLLKLHPTSVIHPAALISGDVEVGPYCLIGPDVTLKDGVRLLGHVSINGNTVLEENVVVHPFAVLGQSPQHWEYKDQPTGLVVGSGTQIREHVTLHIGTPQGGGLTKVGKNCMIMVGSHVGHDCRVGDRVMMANNTVLGGHVVLEDDVFVGGMVAIHQFTWIGRGAMITGCSAVADDVIPYGIAMGNRAVLEGINMYRLKKNNFSREEIKAFHAAYVHLFKNYGKTFSERVLTLPEKILQYPTVLELKNFVLSLRKRPLCMTKSAASDAMTDVARAL